MLDDKKINTHIDAVMAGFRAMYELREKPHFEFGCIAPVLTEDEINVFDDLIAVRIINEFNIYVSIGYESRFLIINVSDNFEDIE